MTAAEAGDSAKGKSAQPQNTEVNEEASFADFWASSMSAFV
jgi:hypothetical protein